MRRKEIMQLYQSAEDAMFPDGAKLLLIIVNKTIENPDLDLYDSVRYSWKISRRRAAKADYVLAVAYGLIVGVFEPEEWMEATQAKFPDIPPKHGNWDHQEGRSGFRGRRAPDHIKNLYLRKRVPKELRKKGAAAPFRYVGV
jgi:hypothetical protein